MRRALATLTAFAAVALATAPGAAAGPGFLNGIMDDALVRGDPANAFPMLKTLRPEVVRVNLWWSEVATRRPANPFNHADPAYNWAPYDYTVIRADAVGSRVMFTIIGTPPWANRRKNWNYPPLRMRDLRAFAYAAAKRYSGREFPTVNLWTAWNEPNLSQFLRPRQGVFGTRYAVAVASIYSAICNSI